MKKNTAAEPGIRAAFLADGGAMRSNPDIARELDVSSRTVRRVRTELGIPSFVQGRRPLYGSMSDAIQARLVRKDSGHTEWTGPCHEEYLTPLVNFNGVSRSVARVLFIEHHGREPVGYVKSTCGTAHCLTPEHLADAAMRKGQTT
jgi:hypothetical protein